MKKLLNTLILAALTVPSMAMAADVDTTSHKEDHHVIPTTDHTFTANVGLISNYLYRGISQTDNGMALQGGFDYAHASGFYAGLWGSNISWITGSGMTTNTGAASLEVDTYFGFKNTFATDFTYDVGFLRYNYPGNYSYTVASGLVKADTNEIYGAMGWKWLSAKYSYSLGNTFASPNAKGSGYLDLSASYPVEALGATLGAHYGKQTFKGMNGVTPNAGLGYSDYKLSATKDIGGYVFGLAYSKTNANAALYTGSSGKVWSKGTAVLSLTRAF